MDNYIGVQKIIETEDLVLVKIDLEILKTWHAHLGYQTGEIQQKTGSLTYDVQVRKDK